MTTILTWVAVAITTLVANFYGFRRGYKLAAKRAEVASEEAIGEILEALGTYRNAQRSTIKDAPTWPISPKDYKVH